MPHIDFKRLLQIAMDCMEEDLCSKLKYSTKAQRPLNFSSQPSTDQQHNKNSVLKKG